VLRPAKELRGSELSSGSRHYAAKILDLSHRGNSDINYKRMLRKKFKCFIKVLNNI